MISSARSSPEVRQFQYWAPTTGTGSWACPMAGTHTARNGGQAERGAHCASVSRATEYRAPASAEIGRWGISMRLFGEPMQSRLEPGGLGWKGTGRPPYPNVGAGGARLPGSRALSGIASGPRIFLCTSVGLGG